MREIQEIQTFSGIKETMSNIMLIDGLNLFFRAYMMDPSLGPNGQPVGGIKGTFKILQKLIRENEPDRIFFCWDGPKSAIRRRAVNSNYKEGRKPIRLNRNFGDLTEDEEKKNKYGNHQSSQIPNRTRRTQRQVPTKETCQV